MPKQLDQCVIHASGPAYSFDIDGFYRAVASKLEKGFQLLGPVQVSNAVSASATLYITMLATLVLYDTPNYSEQL